MPKHRLQPGKSCGFHGPYVRLGASTKLERLVDFVNSFYGPSPAMSPQPDTGEVLAGLVERVTYHNAENGFCVLRARARGHRDVVIVVGHAAAISAVGGNEPRLMGSR
jgi:hypothetical protein